MKKVKFLFGVHCHQPVGNFEHILQDSYEKSYLPFIEAMDAHPRIKFSIHFSGILYDWFMEKHPEYIDYLKKLVKRGQMEVMTAGYYEPVISTIPDNDKLGQIEMQSRFIKEKFAAAPRGMWLTERIWEPHLPKVLERSGIEYVTVDDYHFISAGKEPAELLGHYITEEEGSTLKVFPINKTMRYLIPFKMPEDTINYLRSLASEDGRAAAILADDGEKFGVWPGTHKWVFQEGYLERLLSLLEENAEWVEFMTFSEYIDEYPPLGRIYLPTGSYFEMMEWSLPTASGKKLKRILEDITRQGKLDEYEQFFKGGFFRNFFVKYPESNNMHKRMLQVSQRLSSIKAGKSLLGEKEREARLQEAERELYQGQCNCAYWHGVFGGLYLNYLRNAIYDHILQAENLIDKYTRGKDDYADITVTDFDKDGNDEVIIANSYLNLFFSPSAGGALFEMDYRPKNYNLLNTLARREEVYHSKVKSTPGNKAADTGNGAVSIHDLSHSKEKGLEDLLAYDWHRRISLLDHFLASDTDINQFSRVKYNELGDFVLEPYEFMPQRKGSEVLLALKRSGTVAGNPVKVEKHISLFARQSIVNFAYEVTNLGKQKIDLWFAPEFNFSMLAGNAKDRYYVIDDLELEDNRLGSTGCDEAVCKAKLVDEWKGVSVSLEFEKPALLWRFPIETVSQSESGFERNYQSSVVLPSWKFSLGPGEKWSGKIIIRIEE